MNLCICMREYMEGIGGLGPRKSVSVSIKLS